MEVAEGEQAVAAYARQAETAETVHVEIEIEERIEEIVHTPDKDVLLVKVIREKLQLDEELHLFERDCQDLLEHHGHGRRHIRVVGHHCHRVKLKVHYDHQTKEHEFAPSTTVFSGLQWAISKRGFGLDPVAAAKANLILPGADQPLPREDVIGKYVRKGECSLTVDLTLKDFTNG